jgi:hypothetical protein
MIGDFNSHSPKWGYNDTNEAGKQMEDLLNTSTLQLIYDIDPPIYLYFNGAQTTPDLLVSSDISANTKRIILDDLGTGHKPVVAEISLAQQQRIPDSYTRTSWNFKKANWERFTGMREINLHQGRTDFSHLQIKLAKSSIAALSIALKLASQEEEWRDTNASGPTTLKLLRTNENT